MDGRKLNYRFHNPNESETAARLILQVCMEANEKKVERALCAALAGEAACADGTAAKEGGSRRRAEGGAAR